MSNSEGWGDLQHIYPHGDFAYLVTKWQLMIRITHQMIVHTMIRKLHFLFYYKLKLAVLMVGLLTMLVSTSVAKADAIINFPDPNLGTAIRQAIGKTNGEIYTTDLSGLTYLNASNSGIIDITGLKYCTSLKNLWLRNNQISEIEPLVLNDGISAGDTVNLEGNPLSITSINDYIPQLEERGVNVLYTLPSYIGIDFTITPAEPAEKTSFWIWLVAVFGGLGFLLAISSAIIITRRRLA